MCHINSIRDYIETAQKQTSLTVLHLQPIGMNLTLQNKLFVLHLFTNGTFFVSAVLNFTAETLSTRFDRSTLIYVLYIIFLIYANRV